MHSKLIREIRDALGRGNIAREEVVELATEYSEACEKANQRLGELVQLLSKGFRNEVVERAEQKPPILEFVQHLDFSELAQWKDFLAALKLPQPPALNLIAAEQIEDAYDELRNLDGLLRKNRLLALAQSPIQARLIVLRQLASKDQMNPVWRLDIENLERARIEQIRREYARAKKREDVETLESLYQEISQTWEIPFPSDLKRRIERGKGSVAIRQARGRLEQLAGELNQCLVAYDATKGRLLREEWESENVTAQLESDDPIALSAFEPLAWLMEEDRLQEEQGDFESNVADLERAIDEKCSLDELERKIYAIQKFERELPPTLVQRANLYRSNLETSKRRGFLAIVTAITATLVISVAGIYWFVSTQRAHQEVNEAVAQLEDYLATENVTAASTFFSTLPEQIKTNGRIIEAWSQIEDRRIVKKEKDKQFHYIFESIDFKGKLGGDIDEKIEELKLLANDANEQSLLKKLEIDLGNERNNRSILRNKTFQEKLSGFLEDVQTIDRQPPSQINDAELADLKESIERWISVSTGQTDGRLTVSLENLQQAKQLLDNFNRIARKANQSKMARKAVADILVNQNDFEGFAAKLKAFGAKFPEQKMSADFLSVAAEVSFWKKLSQWQQLANNRFWNDLQYTKKENASVLLKTISELRRDPAKIGIEPNLTAIESFLTNLANSNDKSSDDLAAEIKNFCNQPTFRYQQVLIKNGQFYYLVESKVDADGSATVRYFEDVNDTDKVKRQSLKNDEYDSIGFAGHCNVCKKLWSLDPGRFLNVHLYGIELAHLALNTDGGNGGDVDPAARAIILDYVLEIVAESSSILAKDFQKMRDEMKTIGVNTMNWFEPDNLVVNEKRKILTKDLFPKFKTQLDSLSSRITQSNAGNQAMHKWREISDLKCIGWMQKSASGGWIVVSNEPNKTETDVYAIVPIGGSPNNAEITRIGRLGIGGQIDVATESTVKSGRPVFLYSK